MPYLSQLVLVTYSTLLDLVFPPRCCHCGADGALFCHVCRATVQLSPTTDHDIPGLAGLRVAAAYHGNPALVSALETAKYKFNTALFGDLGAMLAQAVAQKDRNDLLLTYVPLSRQRLRYRGFNQAERLARAAADKLDLPVVHTLVRTRDTAQQAKLSRAARLENVVNAFATAPRADVAGKTVILVDDVASTGATLSSCAQALHAAGAHAVWGLVLARG